MNRNKLSYFYAIYLPAFACKDYSKPEAGDYYLRGYYGRFYRNMKQRKQSKKPKG